MDRDVRRDLGVTYYRFSAREVGRMRQMNPHVLVMIPDNSDDSRTIVVPNRGPGKYYRRQLEKLVKSVGWEITNTSIPRRLY